MDARIYIMLDVRYNELFADCIRNNLVRVFTAEYENFLNVQ